VAELKSLESRTEEVQQSAVQQTESDEPVEENTKFPLPKEPDLVDGTTTVIEVGGSNGYIEDLGQEPEHQESKEQKHNLPETLPEHQSQQQISPLSPQLPVKRPRRQLDFWQNHQHQWQKRPPSLQLPVTPPGRRFDVRQTSYHHHTISLTTLQKPLQPPEQYTQRLHASFPKHRRIKPRFSNNVPKPFQQAQECGMKAATLPYRAEAQSSISSRGKAGPKTISNGTAFGIQKFFNAVAALKRAAIQQKEAQSEPKPETEFSKKDQRPTFDLGSKLEDVFKHEASSNTPAKQDLKYDSNLQSEEVANPDDEPKPRAEQKVDIQGKSRSDSVMKSQQISRATQCPSPDLMYGISSPESAVSDESISPMVEDSSLIISEAERLDISIPQTGQGSRIKPKVSFFNTLQRDRNPLVPSYSRPNPTIPHTRLRSSSFSCIQDRLSAASSEKRCNPISLP
jgi:hypothetical protein